MVIFANNDQKSKPDITTINQSICTQNNFKMFMQGP